MKIRQVFLAVLLMFVLAIPSQASLFSLLGGVSLDLFNKTVTNVKADVDAALVKVQASLNNVTTEVGVMKNNQINMQNEMGVMKNSVLTMQNQLNASVQAQAHVNTPIGANNKVQDDTAGRDINETKNVTITNDPKLMKYIIGSLLGILFWMIRKQSAQTAKFEELMLSKDFYKQQLTLRLENQEELAKVQQLKDNVLQKQQGTSVVKTIASFLKKPVI